MTRLSRITGAELRKIAMFVGGMIGAAYEAGWQAAERPTLLVLYGSMMGLPFMLKADEKRAAPHDPPAQAPPNPAPAPAAPPTDPS